METTTTSTEIPEKLFYKAAEVCQFTDTQPYVLRFWESEFPQLASEKNRSGQRVYRRSDIDLVFRIKKLLYQEEYTIAGARKAIDEDRATVVPPPPPAKARSRRAETQAEAPAHAESAAPSSLFGESRPEAPEAPASAAVEEMARYQQQYEETLVALEALKSDFARSVELRRRVAARLEAAIEG